MKTDDPKGSVGPNPTRSANMRADMKIQLDPPYSAVWKRGWLCRGSNGRRNVLLFNSKKERMTTTYARYLMAVKLGRFLTDKEQVDHIDGDKTNDAIENLQILSEAENIAKYWEARSRSRHGKTSTPYKRGCRCAACVAFIRAYNKQYRDAHRVQLR